MKKYCCSTYLVAAILLASLSGLGCREVDPTPSYYADLGDEGRPLLPTAPAVRDTRVKAGQAEWKAFEAPGKKAAKSAGGEADKAEAPTADETIADVNSVIDEYNEFIGKKEFDKTVDFFVESQREAAASLIKIMTDMQKTSDELKAGLIEKWPDGKARVEELFTKMNATSEAKMTVTDLKVISDEEVEGKIPAIPSVPSTIKFRLIHDEAEKQDYWFIDSPLLAEFDKYKPMLEMGKAGFTSMSEMLKSGGLPAEQIVQQLEAALKLTESLMPPAAKDDKAKTEAAPEGKEDTKEKDEE